MLLATFSAAETFADITGFIDRKRRCALIVERTQALVVCARATQLDKVAHDVDYIGGVEDLLYRFLVYSAHSEFFVGWIYFVRRWSVLKWNRIFGKSF